MPASGSRAGSVPVPVLLRLLDEAFRGPAWHGPTLRGAVRGVRWAEAYWRPGAHRQSIRALVVHSAYWKYVARRRLTREPVGSFSIEGSNWFAGPTRPSASTWRADLALLDEEHRLLRTVVEALTPRRATLHTSQHRVASDEIIGAAYHDVYHAGQIRLLRRLFADHQQAERGTKAGIAPGRS